MAHSHFIEKCSLCGIVIAQCRCFAKDKKVFHSLCSDCLKKDKKMPRENKEPVLCKECRFNIKGICKRNPPSGYGKAKWPRVGDGDIRVPGIKGNYEIIPHSCFAGEKKA